MHNSKFYTFGKMIHKFRWLIIGLWVLLILSCIPFIPYLINPFKTTGFIDEHSASATAESYLNKELGYNKENKFIILYHSTELLTTNSLFLNKIKKSLSG